MPLIRRGYRYKLKTNPELEQHLLRQAGHVRFVWNKCLALNLHRLKQRHPILWRNEMEFWLTRWKQSEEYGFLKEADSQALQQKIKDLTRAFNDAFDTNQPNKHIPIFKKRGSKDSFRYPQRFKLQGNQVYLPKIGWINYHNSRPFTGTPKNITVIREPDGWYISVQTESEINLKPETNNLIGLDRGVRDFTALSTGKRYTSINAYKKHMEKLAYWQRKLSKRVKFSENWKKIKNKISLIHQKITRLRHDFLHKLSTLLSKRHAVIVLEQLRIKNMSKSAKGTTEQLGINVRQKAGLNRTILDQGWGIFAKMLEYKLTQKGGSVLYVPAAYTSQTCPLCNHRESKNRIHKQFRCVKCEYSNDADIIAAMNIKAAGQAFLTPSVKI